MRYPQLCLPRLCECSLCVETVGHTVNKSARPGWSSSPSALQDTHPCFLASGPQGSLTYHLDSSGIKGAMRDTSVLTSEHRE